MGEATVAFALCVEISDQYGTSMPVAVFTDEVKAGEAVARAERFYKRRAFIKPLPVDPAELPRVARLT